MKLSLAAARKNAGFTQLQAAQKVGVTMQTMSKWEIHNNSIRLDKLIALMDLYHIDFDHLRFNF